MAQHFELRCICDAFRNAAVLGAQAANSWWRPTPAAVFGEIETDERAEIVFAEVWSPVTVAGPDLGDEALKKIIIVADGAELGRYVSLSGIETCNMAPPKDRLWQNRLYSFGTPLDITQQLQNPLLNTTIKVKQNVTVACLAGPTSVPPPISPITQNYRIRLWAKVYKKDELPRFGQMAFPTYLYERTRNRTVPIDKAAIPINVDTWLTLPGGKDQAIPKINPFVRYAQNLLATDGMQGDYQFRLETGQVLEEQEELYFDFDEKDALFIEGLGIKTGSVSFPSVNIARCGLRIDGNYHPKGRDDRVSLFPTTVGINELNFGYLSPMAPAAHPYFAAIPKLPQPYMINNEIGYVVIRDDGVGAVAVNTVIVCLSGTRIEMRG